MPLQWGCLPFICCSFGARQNAFWIRLGKVYIPGQQSSPSPPFLRHLALQCLSKAGACVQVGMDEYEVIRCINYIRTSVSQSRDPRSELAGAVSTPEKPWRDDKYLIPVLPDDAMLFHEFGSSVDLPQASSSRSASLFSH